MRGSVGSWPASCARSSGLRQRCELTSATEDPEGALIRKRFLQGVGLWEEGDESDEDDDRDADRWDALLDSLVEAAQVLHGDSVLEKLIGRDVPVFIAEYLIGPEGSCPRSIGERTRRHPRADRPLVDSVLHSRNRVRLVRRRPLEGPGALPAGPRVRHIGRGRARRRSAARHPELQLDAARNADQTPSTSAVTEAASRRAHHGLSRASASPAPPARLRDRPVVHVRDHVEQLFLALVMLSESRWYPLTVGLANSNALATAGGGATSAFNIVICGSLVSIVPLILAFVLLHRYWRSGYVPTPAARQGNRAVLDEFRAPGRTRFSAALILPEMNGAAPIPDPPEHRPRPTQAPSRGIRRTLERSPRESKRQVTVFGQLKTGWMCGRRCR